MVAESSVLMKSYCPLCQTQPLHTGSWQGSEEDTSGTEGLGESL